MTLRLLQTRNPEMTDDVHTLEAGHPRDRINAAADAGPLFD
jgi:hypothetical protein